MLPHGLTNFIPIFRLTDEENRVVFPSVVLMRVVFKQFTLAENNFKLIGENSVKPFVFN